MAGWAAKRRRITATCRDAAAFADLVSGGACTALIAKCNLDAVRPLARQWQKTRRNELEASLAGLKTQDGQGGLVGIASVGISDLGLGLR